MKTFQDLVNAVAEEKARQMFRNMVREWDTEERKQAMFRDILSVTQEYYQGLAQLDIVMVAKELKIELPPIALCYRDVWGAPDMPPIFKKGDIYVCWFNDKNELVTRDNRGCRHNITGEHDEWFKQHFARIA